MNLQTAAGKGSIGGVKTQVVAAICSTALAVAAMAGIGAWQARTHTAASRTAATQGPAPASRDAMATEEFGGLATAHLPRAFLYYVVGSQEQAELLESQMRDEEAKLSTVGPPLLEQHEIVVVRSPEDLVRLNRAVSDASLAAGANGRPDSYQVVDMRTP